MWGSNVDGDRLRRLESSTPGTLPTNQWHTTGDPDPDAQRMHSPAYPTEEVDDDDSDESRNARDGTWGERDVGMPSPSEAMQDYEALRKDLTDLDRTKSKDTQMSLKRTVSARSRKSRQMERLTTHHTASSHPAASEPGDLEAAAEADEDEFELGQFMRDGHFEKRSEAGSAKKVGVIYKNLTVKGVGSSASFVRTLPDAIIGTFGPDLYHVLCRFIPALSFRKGPTHDLIHDFTGCVRDGEMMLVLGRPGSGCSSFLKAISNNRESYAGVEGDVSYGGIPADKQKKMYRGEVNYNPEDDVHFAQLNVWQTFTFALMNKTKKKATDSIPMIADALMKMFGISHTKYTRVGDEYTRGVSGGERKRKEPDGMPVSQMES